MLIRMRENVSRESIMAVVSRAAKEGFDVLVNREQIRVIIVVLGNDTEILDQSAFRELTGVRDVELTETPLCLSLEDFSSTIEGFCEGWEILREG